jgi:hypothetical protein
MPADVRVARDVIPANAGIQHFQVIFWMPAFAGMTNKSPRTEFEIGSNRNLMRLRSSLDQKKLAPGLSGFSNNAES